MCSKIKSCLNQHKAEEISVINLEGKSNMADFMILANGLSNRHVSSLAEYLRKDLKKIGCQIFSIEGKETGNWILLDLGDIIVHIFKPEVRIFYNLEKMWSSPTKNFSSS